MLHRRSQMCAIGIDNNNNTKLNSSAALSSIPDKFFFFSKNVNLTIIGTEEMCRDRNWERTSIDRIQKIRKHASIL